MNKTVNSASMGCQNPRRDNLTSVFAEHILKSAREIMRNVSFGQLNNGGAFAPCFSCAGMLNQYPFLCHADIRQRVS
ncbi:MAG: hypothetical protein ACREUU_15265 [Gammaproteobacteria bacterium]